MSEHRQPEVTPTEAHRRHTDEEYAAALAKEYEEAPDDDIE